jgi:hypothetical protein
VLLAVERRQILHLVLPVVRVMRLPALTVGVQPLFLLFLVKIVQSIVAIASRHSVLLALVVMNRVATVVVVMAVVVTVVVAVDVIAVIVGVIVAIPIVGNFMHLYKGNLWVILLKDYPFSI